MKKLLHYRAEDFGPKTLCGRRIDSGTGTAARLSDATCPKCLKRAPQPVYEVDPSRCQLFSSIPAVGQTVWVDYLDGRKVEIDVSRLTRDSFLTWLRSQDTHPDRDAGYEHREQVILAVLRYGAES